MSAILTKDMNKCSLFLQISREWKNKNDVTTVFKNFYAYYLCPLGLFSFVINYDTLNSN